MAWKDPTMEIDISKYPEPSDTSLYAALQRFYIYNIRIGRFKVNGQKDTKRN